MPLKKQRGNTGEQISIENLVSQKICLIFTVFLLYHGHGSAERSSGEMANRKIYLIFPIYLFILEYGNKIK